MSDRLEAIGLELCAIQIMLGQAKDELENMSSIAEGMALEKRIEQIGRMLTELQPHVFDVYHDAMAKAKARGLLLH
jgi:hypothetical protein